MCIYERQHNNQLQQNKVFHNINLGVTNEGNVKKSDNVPVQEQQCDSVKMCLIYTETGTNEHRARWLNSGFMKALNRIKVLESLNWNLYHIFD